MEPYRVHPDAATIEAKRRVCQNEGVTVSIRILIREAVPILNLRVLDPMGHHIHSADTEHGAIHIKAMEHGIHIMSQLFTIVKDLLPVRFLQEFCCSH